MSCFESDAISGKHGGGDKDEGQCAHDRRRQQRGSEDPTNPARTVRVLTIMLPDAAPAPEAGVRNPSPKRPPIMSATGLR
jgi:hypothetical protein